MSKYGIDYYGTAYYGAAALVDFNATPFVAKPVGYSSLELDWVTPAGAWDLLRLVRNSFGFAVAADDGDVLFEDANGVSRIVYLDKGQQPNNVGLKPGNPYYYTLFARDSSSLVWKRAGDTIGISVKDYNTSTNMYNYLPTILTSQAPYDASLEQNNEQLRKFLSLFALHLDLYKSQAENIANRYDVTNLNGVLIPVFMKQFGLTYEPELGLKQSRILLRNATILYEDKGSLKGISQFIKAYAGYDNKIAKGKNLMLDYNDSSFEESIGSWASLSNATLSRYSSTTTPLVAPYLEPTAQASFPNKTSGVLKVVSTTTATTSITLSGAKAINYGVPVVAGTTYTLSGYSKAASTARGVTAQISWYTKAGVLISTSTVGSSSTNSTSAWVRVTKSAAAPTNAYFAIPIFNITSTATSEVHYFDAIQLEASATATTFQEARQILITLKASRINELTNPNFETTTTGWSATNGTFVLTNSESESPSGDYASPISGGALEIYSIAPGEVKMTSASMGVLSGNDYTFSIYASSGSLSKTYSAKVFIKWYDNTSTLISEVNSSTISVNGAYVRPYLTATAPTNATTAKVGFKWTSTIAGEEIIVDASLFEKSSFLNAFFDGSHGIADATDIFWEGGVANAGRSHYYKNRSSTTKRLITTLPNWITYGSTFELFLAQPD